MLTLFAPPSVPRSLIRPPLYRKACCAEFTAVNELPTTWPIALMAVPTLVGPPNVPRSLILPALYRKACSAPAEISELPTTCERSLRLLAELVSPPSVPRSLIAKLGLAGGSAGGGEAMRDSAATEGLAAAPEPAPMGSPASANSVDATIQPRGIMENSFQDTV